eukprot:CAMPEP_0116556402 /NCGR_PEP_ID=MMETSP0397-20121206/8675_1 /TAXON_ID=216820 /ORGANISM="Cyclophora tenuis, Strain ECT3854" /LENGTH=258 /DNA_ID=CAMNT_0004081765 /DNA_START=66 /DNA_END=843 /DNA_ORIENTATION=+
MTATTTISMNDTIIGFVDHVLVVSYGRGDTPNVALLATVLAEKSGTDSDDDDEEDEYSPASLLELLVDDDRDLCMAGGLVGTVVCVLLELVHHDGLPRLSSLIQSIVAIAIFVGMGGLVHLALEWYEQYDKKHDIQAMISRTICIHAPWLPKAMVKLGNALIAATAPKPKQQQQQKNQTSTEPRRVSSLSVSFKDDFDNNDDDDDDDNGGSSGSGGVDDETDCSGSSTTGTITTKAYRHEDVRVTIAVEPSVRHYKSE